MDWGSMDIIFASEDQLKSDGATSEPLESETRVPVENRHQTTENQGDACSVATQTDTNGNGSRNATEHLLNRYRCQIWRQKAKIRQLELKAKNPQIAIKDVLDFTKRTLPSSLHNFLKMQLKCTSVKPRGRRYTNEELMYALAIYYQGPRAYRQLRTRFYLPSPRALRARLQSIQMLPGFQDTVIGILEEKHRNANAADKYVIVSFDEIQLRRKLTYLRGDDYVEGFEDFGTLGRTSRQADHALVFMVRGLTQNWKQPVGFFYSSGPTPAGILEELLLDCVRKLKNAGLNPVATVCDMGKPNQQLMRKLGVTVEDPTFEVDGHALVALYDVPHLFKCIRNCVNKHSVSIDGNVVAWNHVVRFFKADSTRSIRTAPRLRRKHIYLEPFKKMKVKLATQLFSRSVASGMRIYADCGLIPDGCRATADAFLRLNDTFDVLNSSRTLDSCTKKRALSSSTEPGHIALLTEARDWLSRWRIGDSGSSDSVIGLQLTINAVILLWKTVKPSVKALCTRRLNQDCLENFFGMVRQVNGQNDHPNPTQFRHAFRKVSLTDMLKGSDNTNCEPDADKLLAIATSVAARPGRPVSKVAVDFPLAPTEVKDPAVDFALENSLTYVSGWLAHREEAQHSCDVCTRALIDEGRIVRRSRETLLGLKSFTGLTCTDIGSLKCPSEGLYRVVVMCYKSFQSLAQSVIGSHGVAQRLLLFVQRSDEYKLLETSMCRKNVLQSMMSRAIRLQLHVLTAEMTAKVGKGANRLNRKHLKVVSRPAEV